MIFTKPKKLTWVSVYKKILKEGAPCIQKEIERLMRLGIQNRKAAIWLLQMNLTALSFYFPKEDQDRLFTILKSYANN